MNEREYADRYLGPYKSHGNEIVPELCPFCHGGEHRDKNTFALNIEKHTYNCKRGSCGKQGHFSELLRDVGERFEDAPSYRTQKTYKPSTAKTAAPTDQVTKYITSRGIKPATITAYGICADESGNIAFPYYRCEEDYKAKRPTFVKFRKPEKVETGPKMWRETDTEPILFGLHLCKPGRPILYITEGEFDCMAVYQATEGEFNVVSVPSGASDFTWIDTCSAVLEQYENIAVVGDNDEPGKKMITEINRKLEGKVVFAPDFSRYKGYKDANEIYYRCGQAVLLDAVTSVRPMPIVGVKQLADVRAADISKMSRSYIGLPTIDKALGGFFEGDLTIWTGKRGEGKSSILNQVILDARENEMSTCVYSGEVPDDQFKWAMLLCASGALGVKKATDPKTGREVYYTSAEDEEKFDRWIRQKIWIYDNSIVKLDERDSVMDIFAETYKRYNCTVFVVDNLMTVSIGATHSGDVMQTQAEFVIRLRKFAEKYGVHVHCVVHPRKTPGSVGDSDDVSGMSTITNIACNVISIHRCNDKEKQEYNADSIVSILKNRRYGERVDVPLCYDKTSRRFYERYKEQKEYSWKNPKWEELKDGENI